jgi:hypothetical protein
MHFRSRAATPYYEGETLRELMIMSVVLTVVVVAIYISFAS